MLFLNIQGLQNKVDVLEHFLPVNETDKISTIGQL